MYLAFPHASIASHLGHNLIAIKRTCQDNRLKRSASSRQPADDEDEGDGAVEEEVDVWRRHGTRDATKEKFSFALYLRQVVLAIEQYSGLDLDGDGKAAPKIPYYDDNTSEVQLIITTLNGGHNSGRSYVYKAEQDVAQTWLDLLLEKSQHAKQVLYDRYMEEEYGNSRSLSLSLPLARNLRP